MSTKGKITDPALREARRLHKAEVRRQYDETRKLGHYMLSVYVPNQWKEPGLGVAVREFIATLIAATRNSGKRKSSIVELIKAEEGRVRTASTNDGGKGQF